MDDFSEFSSIANQIGNMPEEINPNDIQDLADYPRDSFVNRSNNKYFNNINNSKSPFQQQQHFPIDDNDSNSSSDEYESGYSKDFLKNLSLSQEIPKYQEKKSGTNNKYMNNFSNNSDNSYFNNYYNKNNANNYNGSRNPNLIYKSDNNFQQQKYENYKNYNFKQISYPTHQVRNNNLQIPGPIPQDTEMNDEEEEQEQEKEIELNNQEQEEEQEENYEQENNNEQNELNNNNFKNKNYNDNYANNFNENIQRIDTNFETSNPPITPSYDKKKLNELLAKCRKNGIPPSDSDFDFNSWKEFYPITEKFFLWEKGKIIPNQVIIKNEDDPKNLEIYEGEINAQGEKHGKGRMTTPNYTRIGTWRDDEFTGWGRESRINGDVFEGRFVDGAIYGKGINQNKKGNIYVGEFVDSKREGKGGLKTHKIEYEGEFKNDKFNGKGKLKFLREKHEYEGEFKNNEINGMGIFKWSNGEIYEGEMTNGRMNGYGKYKYSNGQIYEGIYVNGVKQGLGKLISSKSIYEGEFKNGQPEGEGELTLKGKKIKVIYKNGKIYKK